MDEKPYILDPYYVGIVIYTLVLATENQSGLGQMPSGYGQFGWFATPEFPTLMWECGCGKGQDCEHPAIYHVKRYEDGFAFIVDVMAVPIPCAPQMYKLQGGMEGCSTVADWLKLNEAQTLREKVQLDMEIQPLVDQIETLIQLGDIDGAYALSHSVGDEFVASRLHEKLATIHLLPLAWEQRHSRKYLDMIADGKTDDEIFQAMARDQVAQDVFDYVSEVLAGVPGQMFGNLDDLSDDGFWATGANNIIQ